MKKYMYKLPTLIILLFSTFILFSQEKENYLTGVWKDVTLGHEIGSSNIISRDFDGDGLQEILFSGKLGYSYSPVQTFLTLYSYNGNGYEIKWLSNRFSEGKNIRVIQATDNDNDGICDIYIVHEDGSVTIFNGENMSITGSYETDARYADQGKIKDVDGDGIPEFVFVSHNEYNRYLYIYSLPGFTLKYTTGEYGGKDVEVGDVDGDGNNEIILSDGYVLDGSTYEIEWQFSSDSQKFIELGYANTDSVKDIFAASYTGRVTAFNAINKDTIWTTTDCGGIKAFKVYYQNDECRFLTAPNNFGVSVFGYDALTGQKLWQCYDDIEFVTNLETGDPDNDGVDEFLYGSEPSLFGPACLTAASLEDHKVEWKSDGNSGFPFFSICDLDNDDTADIVEIAKRIIDLNTLKSKIIIANAVTHRETNFLELSGTGNCQSVSAMKTGNINETPQKEIVVGLNGYIYVYDGLTLQLLWKSFKMGTVKDIEIADVDNDGDVELVIGIKINDIGRLYIYNGKTFERELNISCNYVVKDIEIANCDLDESPEIIVDTYNAIYVYDGATYSLEKEINIDKIVSIEVCDYNRDGMPDLAAGSQNGNIYFIRCSDFLVADSFNAFAYKAVSSIKIANIDSTKTLEIIAGGPSLKIFSADDFHLIWEDTGKGEITYSPDNIFVSDINNNGYKDLFYNEVV